MSLNTVNRTIEFDYGHRLGGRYKFKCRHLHGHRGKAHIVLSYEQKNNLDMGIDFSEIKRRVDGWVQDNWDHGCLVAPEDNELMSFLNNGDYVNKNYTMTLGLPTAENISRELFFITKTLMQGTGLDVHRIVFFETPNSFVECFGLTPEEEDLLNQNTELMESLNGFLNQIGVLEYHV